MLNTFSAFMEKAILVLLITMIFILLGLSIIAVVYHRYLAAIGFIIVVFIGITGLVRENQGRFPDE